MTSPHRELGLTDGEYERIVEMLGPRAQRGRARDLQPDVVRALRLQALAQAAQDAARPRAARRDGPGRERRRGRRRRRPGVRVQGRVAQPPERGRAVPGRGHRRRRHPARRLRGRRAADRGARLAALRRAGESARSRYLLERAVAGIGHYGNSIGVATVGGEIYFESAYEQNCLVNAMCLGLIETERLIRSAAAGRRQRRRAVRRPHRPRRHRRRLGARLRRARRRRRGQAPERADRRPVRGASCSSARSSCSTAGCSSRCRTSARRA